MSTRINVTVGDGGLLDRNAQQTAANRQARALADGRAKAEAEGTAARVDRLAAEGRDPQGSPLAVPSRTSPTQARYGSSGVVRPIPQPAATRTGTDLDDVYILYHRSSPTFVDNTFARPAALILDSLGRERAVEMITSMLASGPPYRPRGTGFGTVFPATDPLFVSGQGLFNSNYFVVNPPSYDEYFPSGLLNPNTLDESYIRSDFLRTRSGEPGLVLKPSGRGSRGLTVEADVNTFNPADRTINNQFIVLIANANTFSPSWRITVTLGSIFNITEGRENALFNRVYVEIRKTSDQTVATTLFKGPLPEIANINTVFKRVAVCINYATSSINVFINGKLIPQPPLVESTGNSTILIDDLASVSNVFVSSSAWIFPPNEPASAFYSAPITKLAVGAVRFTPRVLYTSDYTVGPIQPRG